MKLLVDSGCDLPKEILKKYDIDMIPLTVMEDEKEYYDKETIQPKELYKNMRKGKKYNTAQVSPNRIYSKFEDYAREGESVIYLCFSSGLSGNFQTSCLVRDTLKEEYNDLDIHIIDSKSASVGIGIIATRAGRLIKEGKTKEEVIIDINNSVNNVEHVFSVEELVYLYNGGRLNKIETMAGTLLSIKPILYINSEGKLSFKDKARGNKKLLNKIEKLIKDNIEEDSENIEIGLVYGDNYDFAIKVKKMIEKEFKPKNIIMDNMGSSIAAHTGPGVIGITFFKKNK